MTDAAGTVATWQSRPRAAAYGLACAVAFCALTALCAQVRVPVPGTPVPMTLQLAAVLLTGLCLSPRVAGGAMLLYVFCGACGLPVFAPASAGLWGITGGYIAGFVLAAPVVSVICRRSRRLPRTIPAAAAGVAVVFACGALWPMILFGQSAAAAVSAGVSPFVFKAFIELCLVVTALRIASRNSVRNGHPQWIHN